MALQTSNPSGAPGILTISVLRPDGTGLLTTSLGVPGLVEPITLPVAGTYTIVLDPAGMATGGFDVTVTPSTAVALTLAWNGKIRDRVGQGETALSPDGAMDGTLTGTLLGGARTVQQLVLDVPGTGNRWDTIPSNSYWVVGAAPGWDATLLNAANGSVNFGVADGGSFVVFATDYGTILFPSGTTLRLTATFSDATTASATVTVP